MMIFSILTLLWQLFVLSACCLGSGLYLRFLVPKEFSFLNQLLFFLVGGLFLVVLVPQNLLSWTAGSYFRSAHCWRDSRPSVALSSQVYCLEQSILFKLGRSSHDRSHTLDDSFPWVRSNEAGTGMVLRKRL